MGHRDVEDLVPYLFCGPVLIFEIDFDASGAGITGGADDDVIDTGEGAFDESIIGEIEDIDRGQRLHDLSGIGSLDRQQTGLVGNIVHFRLVGIVARRLHFQSFSMFEALTTSM